MNFDANFQLSFIQSLRRNKELFYHVTRERFSSLQNELLILAYYNRAVGYATINDLNIEAVWDDLSTCLYAGGYPKFKRLLYFSYSASNSEASMDDDIIQSLADKTAALVPGFWANPSMEKLFKEIAAFSCFEDQVVSENLVKKHQLKWCYLNADGWGDYYFRLLQQFIPEYPYSKKYSDKNVARFLCDIGDDFHLGFEFNTARYKSMLKECRLASPEFRIVLINADFKKSIKEEAYWPYNEHSQIIVISDEFQHPYFPGVLNNLSVVFSRILLNNTAGFLKMGKVKEGIQVKHDNDLGLLLQRVAFYHFYFITNLIKPYLEYLACAVKSMENKVADKLVVEQIRSLEERNEFVVEQVEKGEALLVQMKTQNAPKHIQEQMKYALEMFKSEVAENTKNIKQFRTQLNSSK